MSIRTDPERNEIDTMLDLVDVAEREVLEVGCGDGRLTWRYADRAAHVTAIDPFGDGIRRAKEQLPDQLRDRVDFRTVPFEDFADSGGPSAFDIVILSWSLC